MKEQFRPTEGQKVCEGRSATADEILVIQVQERLYGCMIGVSSQNHLTITSIPVCEEQIIACSSLSCSVGGLSASGCQRLPGDHEQTWKNLHR